MKELYELEDFSTINRKMNSGEIKPMITKHFRKLTPNMLVKVLKEIKKKEKKLKNNFIINK